MATLYQATTNGDLDEVHKLLSMGDDPNALGPNGDTLVCIAAKNGYTEVAKALLAGGADPKKANTRGVTPLYFAAEAGHAAIVQALLDTGANPDDLNSSLNQTALHIASQQGHQLVITILLAGNANPDIATANGETPLSAAVRNNHVSAFQALIAGGADLSTPVHNRLNALQYAAQRGWADACVLLTRCHKIPVDAYISGTETPLQYAVNGNFINIVVVLLEAGANRNVRLSNNTTEEIVKLIKEA